MSVGRWTCLPVAPQTNRGGFQEELKDASLQLPRAMMIATFANGVLGVVMIITFCFCVTNVEELVNSDSEFPIIQIVHNATGSYAGACVLGSLLLILLYFSTVTTVASTSRQIWAFSRDQVSGSVAYQ